MGGEMIEPKVDGPLDDDPPVRENLILDGFGISAIRGDGAAALAFAGIAVAFLGCFAPWFSAAGQKEYGYTSVGLYLAFAAIGAGWALLRFVNRADRQTLLIVLAFGVATILIAAFEINRVGAVDYGFLSPGEKAEDVASAGWGLYVTIAGGIGAAGGTLLAAFGTGRGSRSSTLETDAL